MNPLYFLIGSLSIVALACAYPSLREKWITRRPFPDEFDEIIAEHFPFYSNFTTSRKYYFQNMIKMFLANKTFYGCGGLTLTDRMRVVVAAQACLLVLNRKTRIYPKLKFILIYPSAFFTEHAKVDDAGSVSVAHQAVLGESWDIGKVILSWDDSINGIRDLSDGQNVVIHEFAHQLDSASGTTNGAPILNSTHLKQWAHVLGEEFSRLVHAKQYNKKSLLDYYGATNAAEFFAVATETFFEQPQKMRRTHPELFEQFLQFYQLDPTDWASPKT